MSSLTWVMTGGFICLLGVGGSGLWLMEQQKRDKLWAARREDTIGGYLKPKIIPGRALMLQIKPKRRGGNLLAQIPMLFGWKEARRVHYPMSWWGIALIMLAPATIGALLATKVIGQSGWFAIPFIDVLLSRVYLVGVSEKFSRTLLSQFPDALSMVSRSVRVGVPLNEAIRVVSREGLVPTRGEFGRASDAVAIGLDLEVALGEMAERNDLPEYRFFATALSLQSQTGGGLTETLETLADTIRKREAARKRGNALAAEAKASILVLTILPIFTGIMLWFTNRSYVDILFTTAPGEKLLGIAVFLLCLGQFSMRQIIKRSLS